MLKIFVKFLITSICLINFVTVFATTPATIPTTSTSATSDAIDHSGNWWYDIGGGYGIGSHGMSGNSTIMSLQYQVTYHQFAAIRLGGLLDSKGNFGKNGFGCYILGPMMCKTSTSYTADAGLLYGWVEHMSYGYASAGLGVGYGQWQKLNNPIEQTIAFPFQIQNFWNISTNQAIGLIFYGNVNKSHTYGALGIAFQFGNVG